MSQKELRPLFISLFISPQRAGPASQVAGSVVTTTHKRRAASTPPAMAKKAKKGMPQKVSGTHKASVLPFLAATEIRIAEQDSDRPLGPVSLRWIATEGKEAEWDAIQWDAVSGMRLFEMKERMMSAAVGQQQPQNPIRDEALRNQLLARRNRLEAVLPQAPPAKFQELLGEIDAALERMEAGTFGICETCHNSSRTIGFYSIR